MLRRLTSLVWFISPALAQEKVSYDDHVFPIFEQACLNCHNPDKTKGGLDLSSYAGTLKGSSGGKIVEPGNVGSSLISVVEHSAEPVMPPEGEKLSNSQIAILKAWIDGGLLENKASSARKAEKPKFETTLRSDPAAKPDGPPPMPEHLLLEPPVLTERPAAIQAIATSPWAPLLAITGQNQVLLHHTDSLELVGIIPFPEGLPVSLSFTPDARYLIVGGGVPGKSGVTVTFDVTTGGRLLTVAREFDTILASDIRPGFDLVVTGGPSRLLKVWNTENGELVHSVKKHTDWITALDLSADGVLLASGDRNGGVWVWESATCNEFHTLRGHQAAISATVFRADSNLLATASEDGSVRFWEMNGGTEVRKIDAHPGGVTAFSFGQDGSSITAGRDRKAKLWKPDFSPARELAKELPALPTAVALDFQAKHAFVADAQGIVRVYQTSDSKRIGEIHANPPAIQDRLRELTRQISTLAQSPAATTPALVSQTAELRAAARHWSAAAINHQAIRAAEESERQSLAVEESYQQFSQLAAAIATQAEAIAQKRHEASSFADHFRSQSLSPELASEVEATLSAIHLKISHHTEQLRKAEEALLGARALADESASAFHRAREEAQELRTSYHQALK
jgi:mono/diheme cytochrome c family protein